MIEHGVRDSVANVTQADEVRADGGTTSFATQFIASAIIYEPTRR